jgi:type VI secretion system protein ImpA
MDLEYDPMYQDLERIARGKGEQRLGDNVIPAEEPDWSEVRKLALELFSRTKDLRVAALLTRALVRTEHIDGLCDGLTLLQRLLERFWDEVHPRLEDGDPAMRMNTLAALVDREAMLRDVRNAMLITSDQHGGISMRDVLIGLGKLQPSEGEAARSQAEIAAAIGVAAASDKRGAIEAVRVCVDRLKAIRALLVDKVGAGTAVDLAPLSDMMKYVALACDSALGAEAPADTEAVAAAPVGGAPLRSAVGEIRTRDDAMRQLDTICSYFERTEPGNPAPLLIRRAQRLMNKSFVEIIEDLAPDSLNRIEDIAGIKRS